MATYLNFSSAVGLGEESTWGTAVSRTHWYRLLSSSIRRVVAKKQRETLSEGGALVSVKHFIARDTVEGTIKLYATFHAMGLILKHAMWGTPATTGPSGGYYTHTYTLGGSAPTGGLTVEVLQGDGSSIVYEGVRIRGMKLTVAAEGVMEVELDVIGETSAAPGSAGVPSFTTTETEIEAHMVGAIGWNSDSYIGHNFELSLDNKLDFRVKLGSKLTKDPKPTALREVMCSAGIDYEGDDPQNDYTGDVAANLTISGTSGTFSFGITVHNAYLDKDEIGIESHGVVPEALAWRGQHVDANSKGLEIVVVNTQSSATAA